MCNCVRLKFSGQTNKETEETNQQHCRQCQKVHNEFVWWSSWNFTVEDSSQALKDAWECFIINEMMESSTSKRRTERSKEDNRRATKAQKAKVRQKVCNTNDPPSLVSGLFWTIEIFDLSRWRKKEEKANKQHHKYKSILNIKNNTAFDLSLNPFVSVVIWSNFTKY